MAKKSSMIAREVKREKLVKKYAAKRAELKAIANDDSKTMEERFTARLKLAKLPRNSAPVRLHNRCQLTGRPHAYYRKLKISRIALRDLGSNGEIPGMVKSSCLWWQHLLPSFRGWVLDVLADEGYILRGYEATTGVDGHPAFDISLKYYEGEAVIREVKRVSTPGRRVYMGANDIPQVRQGLGVSIVSTPKGVMSDASARAANVGGEVLCTVF
ncbi:30S ribosomal protein S8 [Nymphon striatum]|nr:30S ribosomal protein S8 [Nymphon striatum]